MTDRRARVVGVASLLAVAALPFIGRSVISSDGLEVVGESLGLLVNGAFSFGRIPPASHDAMRTAAASHSMYGLFPSLLPLVVLAPAWPFRVALGARVLDALVALTWWAGTCAAGLGFLALARALSRRVSRLWASAFVAGTFLWAYAADSFVEPYAAAAIAFAAALVLRSPSRPVGAAVLWSLACLLKPLLWMTAPCVFLALALDREHGVSNVARATSVFACALVVQGLVNVFRTGSALEVGYGDVVLRFTSPVAHGLWGLLVAPGRSVFLYAPVCLVSLFAFRRLSVAARVLCFVTPLVQVLVVARWWTWEGGSCWGPRYLLPILPLLAAPVVLAPRGVARAAVAAGVAVNLAGVVIAAGSWIAYVEALKPPAGASWPAAGPLRVAEIPALSPVRGHWTLLLRNVAGRDIEPSLPPGASEGMPLPKGADCVSPWLLRRALGLPPIRPMIPRILVRSGAGFLAQGQAEKALALARSASALDPRDPDARRVAADAESRLRDAPAAP